MLDIIKDYINENFKKIMFLLICIFLGLVIGIISYQFLNSGIKSELVQTLRQTLDYSKQENFEQINVIKNGMISNIILILILYISSITFIAPGMISLLNGFKGFAIGIYIPTLFEVFGFGNGLLVLFLLVILPNIIYIPAYVYLSISSLNFHYCILEKKDRIIKLIIKEFYKFILGFSIIALSIIIEQFLSIAVINIYKGM